MSDETKELKRGAIEEFPRGVYVKLQCGCIVTRTSAQTIDKPTHYYRNNNRSRTTHRATEPIVQVRVIEGCGLSVASKRFVGRRKDQTRYHYDLQPEPRKNKGLQAQCHVNRSAATREFYIRAEMVVEIVPDQLEMELHASFRKRR